MVWKHIHLSFPVLIGTTSLLRKYRHCHLSFLIDLQKKRKGGWGERGIFFIKKRKIDQKVSKEDKRQIDVSCSIKKRSLLESLLGKNYY